MPAIEFNGAFGADRNLDEVLTREFLQSLSGLYGLDWHRLHNPENPPLAQLAPWEEEELNAHPQGVVFHAGQRAPVRVFIAISYDDEEA